MWVYPEIWVPQNADVAQRQEHQYDMLALRRFESFHLHEMKCLNCTSETSNKKFCSRSCAASVNNKGKGQKRKKKPAACPRCNSPGSDRICDSCNRRNPTFYKNKIWNELTRDDWRRRRLIEERGIGCEMCFGTEWLGKPIPVEVDHIDGNHNNNEITNVRLLCPNCHATTPTYRGRNKKRKRDVGQPG